MKVCQNNYANLIFNKVTRNDHHPSTANAIYQKSEMTLVSGLQRLSGDLRWEHRAYDLNDS